MQYDMDVIMNNPKALVTLYFPSTGTVDFFNNTIFHAPIYGIVETDFTVDVQGNYSSVESGATAAAQGAFNADQALTGGANRVIHNVTQTLQRYNGYQNPVFSIPITIVKYKDDIDILDIVRTLVSAPAGTYDNITMKAPYGYGFASVKNTLAAFASDSIEAGKKVYEYFANTPDNSSTSSVYNNISSFVYGTWSIRYSDWFYAYNLVLLHASATLSKESVQGTNEPLYARINLTFTTAYLPDARTISGWFLPKFTDFGTENAANIAAGNGNTNAPL